MTLEMVALNPTLDPMLYLFGPTGAVFAANDDNGRNTDARIPAYELPMTGDYVILATRFTTTRVSGGAGEFQLTLTQVLDVPSVVDDAGNDTTDTPPNNTTSPPVVVDATAIANGETVNQSLDNSRYEVRYSFDGAMGDVITVDMIARDGDLDPYLALYTAENKLVAFNDDDTSNASRNARLQTIELPLDGTYIIVASRYGGLNGTTQGAFDLSFAINGQTTPDASGSNLNPARDLLDAPAVEIELGDGLIVLLTPENTPLAYAFQGEVGMVITVSLKREDGDVDAGLVLIDPDGNPIASNTEYSGTADARMEDIRLVTSGEYLVIVGLDDTNTSGNIRLQFIQE